MFDAIVTLTEAGQQVIITAPEIGTYDECVSWIEMILKTLLPYVDVKVTYQCSKH